MQRSEGEEAEPGGEGGLVGVGVRGRVDESGLVPVALISTAVLLRGEPRGKGGLRVTEGGGYIMGVYHGGISWGYIMRVYHEGVS